MTDKPTDRTRDRGMTASSDEGLTRTTGGEGSLGQATGSSGTPGLAEIVDKVIAANPGPVKDYRAGKPTIGFLAGQVMNATHGTNAAEVQAVLRSRLDHAETVGARRSEEAR